MAGTKTDLQTVSYVDLHRYLGTWYEIARLPNRFERRCDADVTANYSLRGDGTIRVVNGCRQKDGSIRRSNGYAKIVDKNTNSKLKVTFFWPFFGNYWIVDLDRDYRYAVVSEPRRKYLWILSRTPQVDPALYQRILERIEVLGFDSSRLIMPKQVANAA